MSTEAEERNSAKYRKGLDLAHLVTGPDDTDFDLEEMDSWPTYDLYEYLEIGWGFDWDEQEEEWTKDLSPEPMPQSKPKKVKPKVTPEQARTWWLRKA